MKIYSSPFSANARKVTMTANLLGLTPEIMTVDLAKGQQRSPEYLALNPNGKVPVLVDGDFVLSESHAIMAYLADTTPGQALYPTELKARADVNKWLFWSANHWGPTIGLLNFERMVKKILGKGDPDPAVVAHAEAQLHVLAKVLDAHLAKNEWLSRGGLTLADVSVGCALQSKVPAQLPIDEHTNVMRWFAKVRELDAWKKTGN